MPPRFIPGGGTPTRWAVLLPWKPPSQNNKENQSNMSIRPLGDRVFVEPVEEAVEQKGGIFIPDSAKEKPLKAKVISVGPGRRDDSGKLIPMDVKAGEFVLTSKYGGTEIKLDDKTYKILSASDILAVVE